MIAMLRQLSTRDQNDTDTNNTLHTLNYAPNARDFAGVF